MSTLTVDSQVNIGDGTPNVTITSSNNQLTLSGNASDVRVEGIADDPSSNQGAANRKFVDSNSFKTSVRAASVSGNFNLTTPPATLDGVTLVNGDRILLRTQTNTVQNGILIYNSGGMVPATSNRSADAQSGYNAFGVIVYVNEGTANGGTLWRCTTDGNFQTNIDFERFPDELTPGGSNTEGQYKDSSVDFEGTSDLTYVTGSPDTLNIGIGSAAALINIGTNASQSGAVNIGSGASSTSITSLGGATINIGNSNAGSTINIATDASHSGAVNIMTGSSATGTLNLGNTNTSSLVNFKGTNILTGLSLVRTTALVSSHVTPLTMIPDGSPAEWTNGADAPTVNFGDGVITINRTGLYYTSFTYGLTSIGAANSNRVIRSWVRINSNAVFTLLCQYQAISTGDSSSPMKLSSSGYLLLSDTDTVEFMFEQGYGANRDVCDATFPGQWSLILVPGS